MLWLVASQGFLRGLHGRMCKPGFSRRALGCAQRKRMPGWDGQEPSTRFALRHGRKALPTKPRPIPWWNTKSREHDGRRLRSTGVCDHPVEEPSVTAADLAAASQFGGSRGRIRPMKYDVVVEIARPEFLAAVRATIPLIDIPRTWKPALDRVWAFLKTHGDLDPGHNLFLYHHPAHRHEAMNIDFGVRVADSFEPEGDVRCIETPAGEVAKTVHVGPYDRLGDAHNS